MDLRSTTSDDLPGTVHRRSFLSSAGLGLGQAALWSLLGRSAAQAAVASAPPQASPPAPGGLPAPEGPRFFLNGGLHFPARARRVIFLCMAGGPSHLETFDPKPTLAALDGQPIPESYTRGQPIAQLQGQKLVCLRPQFEFCRWGRSGQQITELFPHIGGIADELCIVRSLHTDQINHDPAHTVMNTGTSISGRPSMGSWITYGLGSESDDLPGFVVLTSKGGRNPQPIATRQWHHGFLPGQFQGVEFSSGPSPIHYVRNPAGVDRARQRDVVEAITALERLEGSAGSRPEVAARIAQYELAFRMQMSVPGLLDLSGEPRSVLESYGVEAIDGSFASNCLLARRLAERGVRFIHLYHRGWDHHNDLVMYMRQCAGLVDRATAALIRDLKARGLLDETLVVWGGEFGRTPMAQSNKGKVGRDHHIRGFSLWMAGGGIRGGMQHGATDDLGYSAVESPVHVHDLHATMLHLLGIDHERLTYRHQGRDFRLTDVAGKVVREILA